MQRSQSRTPSGFKSVPPPSKEPLPFFTKVARSPDVYIPPTVRARPISTGPSPAQLHRGISHRFGQRLRELRKERQMTQTQMAAKFGIDRTFISDVERGAKSVSLATMEIIALGMGIQLSDLVSGL
jgi:DNA-binding XRE family transcriptional regulator